MRDSELASIFIYIHIFWNILSARISMRVCVCDVFIFAFIESFNIYLMDLINLCDDFRRFVKYCARLALAADFIRMVAFAALPCR